MRRRTAVRGPWSVVHCRETGAGAASLTIARCLRATGEGPASHGVAWGRRDPVHGDRWLPRRRWKNVGGRAVAGGLGGALQPWVLRAAGKSGESPKPPP